jgi:hypothetical protein
MHESSPLPGGAGVAPVAFVDEIDEDSETWLAPKKGVISMIWILEIKTKGELKFGLRQKLCGSKASISRCGP